MWREPSILLTPLINMFWRSALELLPWTQPFRAYEELSPPEVIQEMRELFQVTSSWVEKSLPEGKLNSTTRSAIRASLTKKARQIEESGDYRRLSLWLSIAEEAWKLQPEAEPFVGLVEAIRILIGSETKYLIGIRNNQPAWKHFSRPVGRSTTDLLELLRYGENRRIEVVDQSDASIYPKFGEAMMNVAEYLWPTTDSIRTRKLMEDAYYNQRYIVHPQGAYVKLRHFGALRGITIKVKRGLSDPGFVDIIAIAEIGARELDPDNYKTDPDGFIRKAVIIVDGAYLTGQWSFPNQEPGYDYLCSVIALIYHDLVTAETIHVTVHEKEAGASVWPSDAELPEPSWVYIPRKVKEGYIEPRLKLPSPRILMPHHVSGHKRRGNMTESHREEIKRFEQQTGLRILERLEPGYTFVRPHISPLVESLDELPRFIHARLQSDINRMLHTPLEGGA